MEAENYYIKNRETGKLNVFTTKPFYDALPPVQKNVFKRFCLWSRHQECWVSKGKAENCGYLKSQLNEIGFINQGETGQRLSFSEQVERQQEKAEGRVIRAEASAEKAEQKSDALYNQASNMASAIPFGQPILVGHHSEKRDRNYRDKIHNKFGQAFAEKDKADYYNQKAETAKETAEGLKFQNPVYLSRRIKECEKIIRVLERRLKGKCYTYSPEQEISEKERVFYTNSLGEEREKLEFFQNHMVKLDPDFLSKDHTKPKQKNSKSKGIN